MSSDAFVDSYASARVRLEDGRVLSGEGGLQVWITRREEREIEDAHRYAPEIFRPTPGEMRA